MYTQNYNCFCCDSKHLLSILDLGKQPLANSYLKEEIKSERNFPLELLFCPNCTHLQLKHSVDPNLLFKEYLYVSGTSNTLKEYFKSFVTLTKKYVNNPQTVLDIACNDGSQLDKYKEAGCTTYGIDPAENLYKLSSKNHNIKCDYFNEDSISSFNVKFDIITAQNVFAHNSYPLQFLQTAARHLTTNGRIFIQTSQADMIINNEFDTIYHEHLSFFNVKSFAKLCERAGLNLIDVEKSPIHGNSLIFIVGKTGIDKTRELLDNEVTLTVDMLEYYAYRVKQTISALVSVLETYKANGYRLVGYGAAAKGNTLLNAGKIKLDYIVDDNPLKVGLLTPGMHIPIKPPSTLKTETKILLVPLAWNFFEEIKAKVQMYTFDTDIEVIYLKYFPEIKTYGKTTL